jgi:hypothetical protein
VRFLVACLLGLAALPVSAAVLLTGYGSGDSDAAARVAAREDLAYRLQRAVAASQKTDASRRAFVEGREFPLIGVEFGKAAGKAGRTGYEARLTDASLSAYEREAGSLAERLRKVDAARISEDARFAEGFAWLDQYRRVAAVLQLFSRTPPEVKVDETALERAAAKSLPPLGSAADAAKAVKSALERSSRLPVRVVAPVRAENSEVTGFSGEIADGLRRELGQRASDRSADWTLDGAYRSLDEKILLNLFLLDASFNTERAFVFVLPSAVSRGARAPASANELAAALSRGLVRVDLADAGSGEAPAPAAAGGMGVDVQTERGRRGLYYRPGDHDQLLVKLDRPGYYYIVGHVDKAGTRMSYLMEIGDPARGNRFVRRVEAAAVNQWQAVGPFTVEPPIGLEAVQVFATSENPERALPPAKLDPARNLYLIGTNPGDAVARARGLVLVNMGAQGATAPRTDAPPRAVGEAVLYFTTLQ